MLAVDGSVAMMAPPSAVGAPEVFEVNDSAADLSEAEAVSEAAEANDLAWGLI